MARFDTGITLAERMRVHAAEDTHLYAHLMRAMADDWEVGGPVRQICVGWEDAPAGAVIQLRLLGGLFRIVLTGRAPQLVPFYACLGGSESPGNAWPAVREVLADHVDELREALKVAPQTNEVGRSSALLVGLFEAVRRSGLSEVRLLEPGASAGLNLLVDEFRFVNDSWAFGPEDSPLVLAGGVEGEVQPVDFQIVERRGCDLSPIDASSPEGRLRLRSFVWPFQVERHERLDAALRVASRHPIQVDRAAAGEWLEGQLAASPSHDVLTVVWQSVTRLYWPPEESERVAAAVRVAGLRMPIVHLEMEYPRSAGRHAGAELTIDGSVLGEVERQGGPVHLARVGDHGFPVVVADN